MKKYTVILLYPDYLAENYGQDVYIANRIKAADPEAAVKSAQHEFRTGCAPGRKPMRSTDAAMLVVFEGHLDPVMYGWET